jgi:hypothetical protein
MAQPGRVIVRVRESSTTPEHTPYEVATKRDAGVLVNLSCTRADDPVTHEAVDCDEVTLELECVQEGDDVMNCTSGGTSQRFLRF